MVERRLSKSGFLHLPAAQAGSADADAFGGAFHLRMNRTKIHVPPPLGHVVGVADVVSKLRPLAADFAYLCHDYSGWESGLICKIQILPDFRDFCQTRYGCPSVVALFATSWGFGGGHTWRSATSNWAPQKHDIKCSPNACSPVYLLATEQVSMPGQDEDNRDAGRCMGYTISGWQVFLPGQRVCGAEGASN